MAGMPFSHCRYGLPWDADCAQSGSLAPQLPPPTAHVMTLLLRALARGRRAVDGARALSSKAYAELSVGVPKESVSGERRVALTPASGAYVRND